MTLRLGGDGAITGCTSLENPDLTVSGLTISGSFDAEKVLVASGTAAAPSYTFSGDTDNGLYYAGTNSIGLSTGGTNAILIDSSGRVGIGTTSPDGLLHVKGSNPNVYIETANANEQSDIIFQSHVGGDQGSVSYSLLDNSLRFATNGTSNERMRIDSSGLIGIGRTLDSTYSQYVLQVKSNTDDGSLIHFSRPSDGTSTANDGFLVGLGTDPNSYVFNREPGNLIFGTNDAERMRIDSSGLVLIGTTTEGYANGADNLTIADTGNCGITIRSTSSTVGSIYFSDGTSGTAEYEGYIEYAHNTNALRFATAATERMRIDNLGNLGIGTASPYVAAWGVSAKQVNITGTDYGVLHLTSSSLGTTWSHGAGGTGSINYMAYDGSNHWLTIAPNGITKMQGAYNYATSSAANVHVTPTGQFYRSTSSIKYKTDVETLEDQYADAILKCRPVWYRSVCDGDIVDKSRNKSEFGYYGFIAEEVADIDPRLVSWKTKKDVKNDDNWELKEVHLDPSDYEAEGVNYTNFIPLLLNLIKRQKTELQTLKEKVAALEAQQSCSLKHQVYLNNLTVKIIKTIE